MYLLFAVGMALLVLVALRLPGLAGFDEQVPDAIPDDLIGARVRAAKARTNANVNVKEHSG